MSGEHVDVIGGTTAALDDHGKQRLGELAGDVIGAAARLPGETFQRECRRLARALAGHGGRSRHHRNRHNRKVRRWVDRQSGMCKTVVELDAEADARMWIAIAAAVNGARREQADAAGDDRTFDQIQADTVVELITGAQTADPRTPEISVLIDIDILLHRRANDGTTCETSGGEPLDVDAVRRIGCDGDLVGILVDGGGHVLNVGRAKRFATREQRQALAAMYRTCGFPGCDVSFDRCRIHHVVWWERGGVTNLLPLCHIHHHLVHEGQWSLTLTADRVVTVQRPDGTPFFRGDTTNRLVPVDVSAGRTADGQRNGRERHRHHDGSGNVGDADVADIDELVTALGDAVDTVLARSAERAPP